MAQTDYERAVQRVAEVLKCKSPHLLTAIRCWVDSVGPDAILSATIRDIRECAGAF